MNYFDSYNKKECNGCGVCALKCPKGAIDMKEDDEGFLYPIIDESKCIKCGLCKKICPNRPYPKNDYSKAYIAINNDKTDLYNSASGGCFIALAKYIISKKGVVFGCTLDKNLYVKHEYAEVEEDLIKFQGSKYVRSDLNNSYNEVKHFLDDNRYVLFTGTPCQCHGLKTFLGKDYDNLLIAEIICHSNPSNKIFELYKQNLEIIYNKKIINIKFRNKKDGWKNSQTLIEFEDGTFVHDISYYNAFIAGLINRPSCSNCYFSSSNRLADFTIGDAWGIDKIDSNILDDNSGISLLCINTKKGNKLFNYLNKNMELKSINKKVVFSYNHNSSSKINKNRKKFFAKVNNKKINSNNIIYYMNKYSKNNLLSRGLRKIKKIIKHTKN